MIRTKFKTRKHRPLHFFIQLLIVVFVGLLVGGYLSPKMSLFRTSAQQAQFTFTSSGDIGFSSDAGAALDKIVSSGAAFHLVVGDFSYSNTRPEPEWCDFVKSHVGETFPFQLVTGNHENAPIGDDGFIDNYVACLPDRMNSVVSPFGKYGREYYFDYQNLRVIMIGADNDDGSDPYDYNIGIAHYDWLKDRIIEAKSAGKWVVVGMHKNCITMGVKSCSIGTDLMNLLLSERVDLILQGHDHTYQRSKQLTCATPNSYNSSCVADDGADGVYGRGLGSVIVISGTGGAGLYDVSTTDTEAGYFAAWMGNNINPRKGITKVTVDGQSMGVSFVGIATGNFTDSFVIQDLGLPTPTPTGTPTPTPTSPPIPTPTLSPTPTSIPTPTPGNQIIAGVTDDATIKLNTPSSSSGLSTRLEVDNSPVKHSLFKFSVNGTGGRLIQKAVIRLYNIDKSKSGGTIYKATHNNWSEGTVTWNTAPSLTGFSLGSLGSVSGSSASPKAYEIDVTSSVTGDGIVSYRMTSTSNDGADYISRQGTIGKTPQLIITVAP